MASSSAPIHIIDDEDEFDWEAAVEEINVACQAAENPTSVANFNNFNSNSKLVTNPVREIGKKGKFSSNFASTSSTKQSTLDRFIGLGSTSTTSNGAAGEFSNKVQETNRNVSNAGDTSGGRVEFDDDEISNRYVTIDTEAAKTWIYPVNVPRRDYQFSITRTALFSNTLVVLPTGLGKTLIAAAVMYNYFRWFPEGKIVFAAPSRPLVMQQIEACHKITGIPQEWTIDLTGQTSPEKRAVFWKEKRVFFVTPQVLEKDIHSGTCQVKHLVCLVIDEAHRATGNYSYCVAVRELMDISLQLRILALTATPGGKQQAIQTIIDNLQISTLEYRNESDQDVLPYVHERKIELIQVALGDEAVEINNLLLDVIRPFATKLGSLGVLPKRDIQTLSPCHLLDSREKFRQEPPVSLPHIKYGEIEGYFGVLITLYHVRKLLSSHGIRPSFEMLDEKLKQGSFARYVSRNEALLKAKLLMQQTVSHGAPSPKLAKMLEVLVDHFREKDPQNSRVIIFSNFRGSVRDIMNALANIGGLVKATEFIGQSSGKTLKGQSQKVQQAVLQKFRTGGYNVIVATSIGEEGLDIMEVDLVICFDANVSPLRMIQRMGRTGRKSAGRVVVLACEGSELNGYKRKQANSKSVNKHMRNNGMNSFTFHSSPRMVPHFLRPEVQFLEMSIEQFVPRGKKVKDDTDPVSVATYKTKLTDSETEILAKYFSSTGEVYWKPSLIAFPHFQAFPSCVKKVAHSSRTGILIDAMQYLQDLPYSKDMSHPLSDEIMEDSEIDPAEDDLETLLESDTELEEITRTKEDIINKHTLLFGSSEFVSVDDLGNVMILSLPQLPLRSMPLADELSMDFRDPELSPQLTNFIKSGTVPESPTRTWNSEYTNFTLPDLVSSPIRDDILSSKIDDDTSPVPAVIKDTQTPVASKDWALDSGEKCETVEQKCKYRRLRKHGDLNRKTLPESKKETCLNRKRKNLIVKGEKKRAKDVAVYVDEEAEVSSEVSGSDDEDEQNNSSYEDSFIDDGGVSPASAEVTKTDMMGIYRRSLLSQSPFQRFPNVSVNVSPDSVVQSSRTNESGSSSGTKHHETPQSGLDSMARISQELATENDVNDRKRKLGLYQAQSLPMVNLETEFSLLSETVSTKVEENTDIFEDDDQFFQGIDLDAVEEEAARLLKLKSEGLKDKTEMTSQSLSRNINIPEAPSFDLGF